LLQNFDAFRLERRGQKAPSIGHQDPGRYIEQPPEFEASRMDAHSNPSAKFYSNRGGFALAQQNNAKSIVLFPVFVVVLVLDLSRTNDSPLLRASIGANRP
jgi:hypothetical protein